YWDSLPRRHVPSGLYPTVEHARHLLAVCWLSIYATVFVSLPFMPRFVRTMVAAGRSDPAMAYQIRLVALLAGLIFAPTFMVWADLATHTPRRHQLALPLTTALSGYTSILWICAILSHRRLGARWRDFKGPS
ncbi:MAG: hypothetical protein ACOVQI_13975, partial [Tagaea sp.]